MATIRTALQSLVKKGNMMRSTSEISAIPILLVRPLSTYSALKAPRKIKREPEPVPSWANYDGNRLCEDGVDPNRLIWEGYKRNHKGGVPPQRTRASCIRGRKVTGNPCPVCSRKIDIQYIDTALLSQFICPHSGRTLQPKKTGLCRKQQKKLEAAIEVARDCGNLPFVAPRQIPDVMKITPPWNKNDVIE